MADPADVIRDSPIDFSTAVGYALHRTMRWLLLAYFVGSVLLTYGLSLLVDGTGIPLLGEIVGIAIAVAGGALMFGGGIGVLFKVIVDGTTLALALQDGESAE